jgi:hypothetical protein
MIRCTLAKSARAKINAGVDLISDVLPFGRLWYGEPNAVSEAYGELVFQVPAAQEDRARRLTHSHLKQLIHLANNTL